MIPREAFLPLFLLSTASLALWTDVRFPGLRPGRWLALHFALSLLLGHFAGPLLALAGGPLGTFAAGVALLFYVLLVGLWTLRALAEMIPGGGGGLGARA